MEVFEDIKHNVVKTTLWAGKIAAFKNCALSRKDWRQIYQAPLFTFGYWFRKMQTGSPMKEFCEDPIFARLPSEQEFCSDRITDHAPVTICLPGNIRIEVDADCPAGLITALLHAIKNYA